MRKWKYGFVVLVCITICFSNALADLFSLFDELLAERQPSISLAINRAPDSESVDENGHHSYEYTHFTYDDYHLLGQYLAENECKVEIIDKTEGQFVQVRVFYGRLEHCFQLYYDFENQVIRAIYNDGYLPEKGTALCTTNKLSVLPVMQELHNYPMPSMGYIMLEKASNEQELEDGSLQVEYSNVTKMNYEQWIRYYKSCKFSLIDESDENGIISSVISKDWVKMTFRFNPLQHTMTLVYPRNTIEEIIDYEVAYQAQFDQGKHILFGSYPQTYSGNDDTPIEWLILRRDGQHILLISRYGLDTQQYNYLEHGDTTWQKCSLRAWLNDEFYKRAFTKEEQKAILKTNVDNSQKQCNPDYDGKGGKDTKDNIFLLSSAEAKTYFNVQKWEHREENNTYARVAPTQYAIRQGAKTESGKKYLTEDGLASACWWLRSPGFFQSDAADIFYNGTTDQQSAASTYIVVRPVLWLDIDKAFSPN